MPANKKHLTQSAIQRAAKLTAGFIGGYLVTLSIHIVLLNWIDPTNLLITLQFAGFMLWCVLLLLAFMAKNGFKVWAIYLLICGLCGLLNYCFPFNP